MLTVGPDTYIRMMRDVGALHFGSVWKVSKAAPYSGTHYYLDLTREGAAHKHASLVNALLQQGVDYVVLPNEGELAKQPLPQARFGSFIRKATTIPVSKLP